MMQADGLKKSFVIQKNKGEKSGNVNRFISTVVLYKSKVEDVRKTKDRMTN